MEVLQIVNEINVFLCALISNSIIVFLYKVYTILRTILHYSFIIIVFLFSDFRVCFAHSFIYRTEISKFIRDSLCMQLEYVYM